MRSNRLRLVLCCSVLLCVAGMVTPAAAVPLPGAIFTTNNTCTQVNGNIYDAKDAVYLNGGPQNHPGAAGLADGVYYVQVTDPGGSTLLGTSVGSTNPTPVTVAAGVFTSCVQLSNLVLKASDGTAGFDTTPNSGNEYKVWISKDPLFANNSTKTDNFKVRSEEPPLSVITGVKFYDANVNGVQDAGELPIAGWRFTLWSTTYSEFVPYTNTTDVNGVYRFENLEPATYGLCEVIPQAAPTWLPTTRTVEFPITVPPNPPTYQFGNVCLGSSGGAGGGIGFWSNKNGEAVFAGISKVDTFCASDNAPTATSQSTLTFLSSLNLVKGDGTAFDPTTYCQFRTWILGATAVNMAYMLSAQMAAMQLNVVKGFVDPTALVYAPGVPSANAFGFTTIAALLTDANTALGANPNTTTAGAARTLQEAIKNALDGGNNNRNFVQPTACDVNYAVTEPSCIPQT